MPDAKQSLRVKLFDKFIADGYSSKEYSPFLMLQMLLLECRVPEDRAADAAELLLMSFGSLKTILNCSPEKISDCAGISVTSAQSLRVFGSFIARISSERARLPVCVSCREELYGYINAIYSLALSEKLYMLNIVREKAVRLCLISEGERDSVRINFKRILSQMFYVGSDGKFILIHNHPRGSGEPSPEDISSTAVIANRALECGGEMLAHYVYGNDGIFEVPMQCNYAQYLFGDQYD